MADRGYVGDENSVAREHDKGYIGVAGVARDLESGYVGVDGVARKVYESGAKWDRYAVYYGESRETVASKNGPYLSYTLPNDLTVISTKCSFDKQTGELVVGEIRGELPVGSSATLTDIGNRHVFASAAANTTQATPRYYDIDTSTAASRVLNISRTQAEATAYAGWKVYNVTRTGPEQGEYIDTVSADEGTYPDNGVLGGYWYVKQE